MTHPIWAAVEAQARSEWETAVKSSPKDTVVYRYFDGRGSLLYVGSTKNFHKRNLQHKRSAKWHGRASRHAVSDAMPAQIALGAEFLAILREGPQFNTYRATGYAGPGSAPFEVRLSELYEALPHDDQMTLMRDALQGVADDLLGSAAQAVST